MSTSVVAYRNPARELERVSVAPRALAAANANEALPSSGRALSAEPELRHTYRWSDPRRGVGMSWQGWTGTLALHGLLAAVVAVVAWTSRPVPPSLPTITVVFESPAAPPAAVQPEPQPPAPAAQPRVETPPPAAQPAAPVTNAAPVPAAPTEVALLPPPPPPRPVLREAAAPRPQPVSQPAPTPVSAPVASPAPTSHSGPVPSVAAAVVPVIPPRPASGIASNRKPVYPLAARNQRWQGRVMLQVAVAASGDPLSVHVIASSGHALLDDSALAAVRTWRFVPASQGGRPVPGTVDVPVDFRMVD